jgi:hypothetical protein
MMRGQSDENESSAKIGVPLATQITSFARLGRIDSDPCPGFERLVRTIARVGTDRLYGARKFVARNQWFVQSRIANATVQIAVEVGAADAHRRQAQQDLAGPGRARMRVLLDSHVSWTMQNGG